jgi:chloramphenicol-sensitive protein RarD
VAGGEVAAVPHQVSTRRGVVEGLIAYSLWGLFPLYFVLLDSVPALEIAANRVLWTFLICLVLLTLLKRWPVMLALLRDRRALVILSLGGVALAANWSIYIWAVEQGEVVQGALGYYINPLVTVLFGVVLLRERLSRGQIAALGLATLAVLVLTWDYGQPPWIALSLAATFGLYGLAKKLVSTTAIESLTVETAAVLLPALILLGVALGDGSSAWTTADPWTLALLLGSGVLTTVPLLLFGRASRSVPLTTLGLMQYATPTLQFIVGVVVLNESFPPSRFVGFALVWLALVVLTLDGWRRHRATVDPEVEPTY